MTITKPYIKTVIFDMEKKKDFHGKMWNLLKKKDIKSHVYTKLEKCS